jgi:hypothetical protein
VLAEVPPQPGNMGKANMEARPKPPRKMLRREGLLRALSRTSWKCSLLDVLSMGSNEEWDMKKLLQVKELSIYRAVVSFV